MLVSIKMGRHCAFIDLICCWLNTTRPFCTARKNKLVLDQRSLSQDCSFKHNMSNINPIILKQAHYSL